MKGYLPDLQRRCGLRLVTGFLTAPRQSPREGTSPVLCPGRLRPRAASGYEQVGSEELPFLVGQVVGAILRRRWPR